jgi:hypothetical protein
MSSIGKFEVAAIAPELLVFSEHVDYDPYSAAACSARFTIVCEESWVREWELSGACLFIPKGRFHLLLLIIIVLATTQRDLVVATKRGPCLVRAVVV